MTYTIENLMAKLKDNKEKVINYSNKINDEIAINLADALKVNNTLESLNLSNNEISDAGATALADALKVNNTLEFLNLSNNEISDAGATALADALKVNNTLKELFLNYNYIATDGAMALAEALKVNKTLIKLDAERNQITDEGIKALKQIHEINENFKLECFANYNSLIILKESLKGFNGNLIKRAKRTFNNDELILKFLPHKKVDDIKDIDLNNRDVYLYKNYYIMDEELYINHKNIERTIGHIRSDLNDDEVEKILKSELKSSEEFYKKVKEALKLKIEEMRFIEEHEEPAEALLSKYDYENAKDKMDDYIGEYKDENEYLKEYIEDLCEGLPKRSINKIKYYIDYQKLNNAVFSQDLESIEHEGKVYIFFKYK